MDHCSPKNAYAYGREYVKDRVLFVAIWPQVEFRVFHELIEDEQRAVGEIDKLGDQNCFVACFVTVRLRETGMSREKGKKRGHE